MKKLMMLLLMLSTGFILSGCDLVGEDVISDVQEEFCVTNPDHETCQPDSITIDTGIIAIEALISDYLNKDMLSSEVCSKYFEGIDDDCDLERDENLENGITIELKALDSDDDNDSIYNATLEMTTDGITETVEVQVQLTRQDFGPVQAKIIIPQDEWQGSVEEVKAVFEQFIIDYLDPDTDNDYINNMYFNGEMDAQFGEDRMSDITEGIMISLLDLEEIPNRNDGFLLATLLVTFDGLSEETKLNIRVNRIEMAYRLELGDGEDNDCDSECPIMEIDELTSVFQMYINDYLNPDLSTEYIGQMYFQNYLPPEFGDQRIKDLITIDTVEILKIDYIDDFKGIFNVVLIITEGDIKTTTELEIRVNRIEMSYRLMFDEGIDNDCDGIEMCIELEPNEVKEILKEFYTDLYNPEISTEYIAMTYFNYDIPYEILILRETTTGLNVSVNILNVALISDDPNGFMMAEIDFTIAGVANKENIKVKVKRLDASSVLIMFQDDETDLMYDALMRIEGLVHDMNMGITTSDTCTTMFVLESKTLCENLLNYHIENKYTAFIESIDFNIDGSFDMVLITLDMENINLETNTFKVSYGGRNSIANPLFIESNNEGNNPLYSN